MLSLKIKSCMTNSPHTIGEDISLIKAVHAMNEHHIRHLPVLNRGNLVGIISERDIKLALSVHPAATDLCVGDVMTEDPYVVNSETSLDVVTERMFQDRIGCTIIRDGVEVHGIFTDLDALQVLTSLIRGESADRRKPSEFPVPRSLKQKPH